MQYVSFQAFCGVGYWMVASQLPAEASCWRKLATVGWDAGHPLNSDASWKKEEGTYEAGSIVSKILPGGFRI